MINFQKILKPRVFGLDLAGPLIKVAQLPDKFGSGTSIQEAVKKARLKTNYVNVCLPEKECFVRLIPKNHDLKKEIEANVPLPLTEIYYDWQETGSNLFIVAAKRKIVDKNITLLQENNLVACSLEPESLAIARALVKDNNNLLIIKTSGQENVFIICSQRIVRFTGLAGLEQTQEYLDFYQSHNGEIVKIILCGDGDLKKASQVLAKLNLAIEIAENPAYAAAIGLALKQDA